MKYWKEFAEPFFLDLFTNLVLISASKRTAAITGLEPSPVAGREV